MRGLDVPSHLGWVDSGVAALGTLQLRQRDLEWDHFALNLEKEVNYDS